MDKNVKLPDAASFTFEAEDHTLGNLLRMYDDRSLVVGCLLF